MTKIQIIILLAYIFYNFADAKSDVAKELNKNRLWHNWDAVQVTLFYATISYLFFGFSYNSALLFIVFLIVRLPLFNIMHNLIKGDRWDHLSDEGIDGFIKKLFKLKH